MDKIQELTSKLYSEGIEKGKEEAEKIIAEAKALSNQIVEDAKKKAQEIIAAAEKEARVKKQYRSRIKTLCF